METLVFEDSDCAVFFGSSPLDSSSSDDEEMVSASFLGTLAEALESLVSVGAVECVETRFFERCEESVSHPEEETLNPCPMEIWCP